MATNGHLSVIRGRRSKCKDTRGPCYEYTKVLITLLGSSAKAMGGSEDIVMPFSNAVLPANLKSLWQTLGLLIRSALQHICKPAELYPLTYEVFCLPSRATHITLLCKNPNRKEGPALVSATPLLSTQVPSTRKDVRYLSKTLTDAPALMTGGARPAAGSCSVLLRSFFALIVSCRISIKLSLLADCSLEFRNPQL